MKKIYFVTIIFVCYFFFCSFSQQPVYLDETKPVDERIEDAFMGRNSKRFFESW